MVSATMVSVMELAGRARVDETVRLPKVLVLVRRPPLPLMVRPPESEPPVRRR